MARWFATVAALAVVAVGVQTLEESQTGREMPLSAQAVGRWFDSDAADRPTEAQPQRDLVEAARVAVPPPEPPRIRATYSSPYPLAYANAMLALHVPQVTFEVWNPDFVEHRVTVTSSMPSYSLEAANTTVVPPRSSVKIEQVLPLLRGTIDEITTPTQIPIQYEAIVDGMARVGETQLIDVLPPDTAVLTIAKYEREYVDGAWRGEWTWVPQYDLLATFVRHNDPEVRELINRAAAYHPLGRMTGSYCLGCESEQDWVHHTQVQVEALYEALQNDYGTVYSNMPNAFNHPYAATQRVSTPAQTLREGGGNCLDGTILFAAAFEALGLRPIIMLRPGHAYFAWQPVPDSDKVMALETTAVGYYSPDMALRMGAQNIAEDAPHYDGSPEPGYYRIDVQAMHDLGVLPNP